MSLDKTLLELLACPECKGKVELLPTGEGLRCPKCKLVYPIKDDIPIMLVDQAESEKK